MLKINSPNRLSLISFMYVLRIYYYISSFKDKVSMLLARDFRIVVICLLDNRLKGNVVFVSEIVRPLISPLL